MMKTIVEFKDTTGVVFARIEAPDLEAMRLRAWNQGRAYERRGLSLLVGRLVHDQGLADQLMLEACRRGGLIAEPSAVLRDGYDFTEEDITR